MGLTMAKLCRRGDEAIDQYGRTTAETTASLIPSINATSIPPA